MRRLQRKTSSAPISPPMRQNATRRRGNGQAKSRGGRSARQTQTPQAQTGESALQTRMSGRRPAFSRDTSGARESAPSTPTEAAQTEKRSHGTNSCSEEAKSDEPGTLDLQDDSDFNSSDVDAALMSVGPEQCEIAKTANIWLKRHMDKRRLERLAQSRGNSSDSCSPTAKRRKGPTIGRCQAIDGVRDILAAGQAAYADGQYDEAILCMHEVIKQQPGLADPYHVLALVYDERGDARKSLDALLLSAYFSTGNEARAIWSRVAAASKQLGFVEQACYAYKRSLGSRTKSSNDLESLGELAKLYFAKGNVDRGLQVMYLAYRQTGNNNIAREIAGKLVELHRWRECLELLEACVQRDRSARPPRADADIWNMYCEVLMEVREFTKCANLLIELFGLKKDSSSCQSNNYLSLASLDLAAIDERLRPRPVDLVAKLAAALCRHINLNGGGEEAVILRLHSIDAVLAYPVEDHHDLHLAIVDALLADSTTDATVAVDSVQPWPRRSSISQGAAQEALRILDVLATCTAFTEDCRERRAMSLWHLGRPEEAALLLEDLMNDSHDRPESQIRALRVRVAEAWLERGALERADGHLGSLCYEDLMRCSTLPTALSAGQRRVYFEELMACMDRSCHVPLDREELDHFAARFRHLIYDCELDYVRLSRFTSSSNLGSVAAQRQENAEHDEDDAEPVVAEEEREKMEADNTAATREDGEQPIEPTNNDGPTSTERHVMEEALARSQGEERQEEDVKPRPMQESIVSFKAAKEGQNVTDLQVTLSNPSVFYKMKRPHLGLESLEDMFGFEAYVSFVIRGVDLLRSRCSQDGSAGAEIVRFVGLFETILTNRKVVSLRNPVKRRYLRILAMKSVTMAFEARLWRIVFKHLRRLCDEGGLNDDLTALLSRMLFAHGDAGGAKETDHRCVYSNRGKRRATYASLITNVRSWALRKLLKNPRSFGLTLLCGHFCLLASKYTLAVAEYCRAHRLAPSNPLAALCAGVAYLSFSMSRTAVFRHGVVLKGFAFINQYKRLRLQSDTQKLAETSTATSAESPAQQESELQLQVTQLVRSAECSYNLARGFHQMGLLSLAVECCRRALAVIRKADDLPAAVSCSKNTNSTRVDVCVLRHSCAYNLAQIYRAQGSMELASRTLWEHVVF